MAANIDLKELCDLIQLEELPVAVSIADWRFLVAFDAELLGPLRRSLIVEAAPTVDSEWQGPVGYFALSAEDRNRDFLERLTIYAWAKLYVGGATVEFLQSLPERIVAELETAIEPDEDVLAQLASLRGHRWLVLSDGNPGDQRYYYFPGAS